MSYDLTPMQFQIFWNAVRRGYCAGAITGALISLVAFALILILGCTTIEWQDVITPPSTTIPAPVTTTIPPPTSTTQPRPWETADYTTVYGPRDLAGVMCPCIQSPAWATPDQGPQGYSQTVPDRVEMRDASNVILGRLEGNGNIWFMRRSITELPAQFWIDFYSKGSVWIYCVNAPTREQTITPVKQ